MTDRTLWWARLSKVFKVASKHTKSSVGLEEHLHIARLSLEVKDYIAHSLPVPPALGLELLTALKKPETSSIRVAGMLAILDDPQDNDPSIIRDIANMLDPERLYISKTADAAALQSLYLSKVTRQINSRAQEAGFDHQSLSAVMSVASAIRTHVIQRTPPPRALELKMGYLLRKEGVSQKDIDTAYTAFANGTDPKGATLNALLDPKKTLYASTATPLASRTGVEHDLNRIRSAARVR